MSMFVCAQNTAQKSFLIRIKSIKSSDAHSVKSGGEDDDGTYQ